MFVGIGTVTNIGAIIIGSTLGLLVGHRLSQRTRSLITDALGLVTLLIAAEAAMSVSDRVLSKAVGHNAPMLIVLAALVIGGLIGSILRIEGRLELLGSRIQRLLSVDRGDDDDEDNESRRRFIEGFVTSSLVFCVGPLTILGAIEDGMGQGANLLFLKSTLDGFASLAFAASFGIGVMASALSIGVVQGLLTVLGFTLGSIVPEPHLLALTATGGLLLIGVSLRLLKIKPLPVADLLPALILAPIITQIVIAVR